MLGNEAEPSQILFIHERAKNLKERDAVMLTLTVIDQLAADG